MHEARVSWPEETAWESSQGRGRCCARQAKPKAAVPDAGAGGHREMHEGSGGGACDGARGRPPAAPGELPIRAFLQREGAAADFRRMNPARFNHAVLVFISQVMAALPLRPCEVESLTGLRHQHLRKLRPGPDEHQEVRISLWTLALFCNGLHIRLHTALAWIMERLMLALTMLGPLEA